MNEYFVELVKRAVEKEFKMGWVKDSRKSGSYLIYGGEYIWDGFIEFYQNNFFVVKYDSEGEHLLACYDSLPKAVEHLENLKGLK